MTTQSLDKLILTEQLLKLQGKPWTKPHGKLMSNNPPKPQRISINLDLEIIEYFKAQAGGQGYQSLINQTLWQVMLSQ